MHVFITKIMTPAGFAAEQCFGMEPAKTTRGGTLLLR